MLIKFRVASNIFLTTRQPLKIEAVLVVETLWINAVARCNTTEALTHQHQGCGYIRRRDAFCTSHIQVYMYYASWSIRFLAWYSALAEHTSVGPNCCIDLVSLSYFWHIFRFHGFVLKFQFSWRVRLCHMLSGSRRFEGIQCFRNVGNRSPIRTPLRLRRLNCRGNFIYVTVCKFGGPFKNLGISSQFMNSGKIFLWQKHAILWAHSQIRAVLTVANQMGTGTGFGSS